MTDSKQEEDKVDLILDYESFNSMVKTKKKFYNIKDIKFIEYDEGIDLDKITCFPNLESMYFEEGLSIQEIPWSRWDEDIIDIEDNFKWEENIISFNEMKNLGYDRFDPMKGIFNLKKLEWIGGLVLEKFTDLLKIPNLKYVANLYILECNFSDFENINDKKFEDLKKILSKIEIQELRIRFFSGNISFFQFLNKEELQKITIDVAYKINDFDCSFINNMRKDIGLYFFSINHFYTEEGGYVTKKMIIEDTKVENKLRPKGYVYIKFIYEDKKEIQGDVDPLTINYPMIKNND